MHVSTTHAQEDTQMHTQEVQRLFLFLILLCMSASPSTPTKNPSVCVYKELTIRE